MLLKVYQVITSAMMRVGDKWEITDEVFQKIQALSFLLHIFGIIVFVIGLVSSTTLSLLGMFIYTLPFLWDKAQLWLATYEE